MVGQLDGAATSSASLPFDPFFSTKTCQRAKGPWDLHHETFFPAHAGYLGRTGFRGPRAGRVPECDAGSYPGAVFLSWPKLASSVLYAQELLVVLSGQNKRRLPTRRVFLSSARVLYSAARICSPRKMWSEALSVRWSSELSRPAVVVWLGCHSLGNCQIIDGTEYFVVCSLHPLLLWPLRGPAVSSQSGSDQSSHNVTYRRRLLLS